MDLLTVARIPPVLAAPTMTIAEALKRMVSFNVGAVVVTDNDRRILGIFSERDVVRRVAIKHLDVENTPISHVMSLNVETATPETTIEEALTRMVRGHFRHLPIVDTLNRVIGIVSVRYLLMRQLGENRLMRRIMESELELAEMH